MGFERHWNGGNPVATHAFNALSFLFPQGEQFFIDAARKVFHSIALYSDPKLKQAVKSFIVKESTHRNQHDQYNAVLETQGFENVVHALLDRLINLSFRYFSPLTNLAIVAGYEHYTAILGNFILCNPHVLKSASPNTALIWGWHAAEETEHKAVCFDLYQAAGGGWLRRVLTFLFVSFDFAFLFGRLFFSLLYRDGCLSPSRIFITIRQYMQFFWGRNGVAWHLLWHGLRYYSFLFHPWNQDNRCQLQAWFSINQTQLREIV